MKNTINPPDKSIALVALSVTASKYAPVGALEWPEQVGPGGPEEVFLRDRDPVGVLRRPEEVGPGGAEEVGPGGAEEVGPGGAEEVRPGGGEEVGDPGAEEVFLVS